MTPSPQNSPKHVLVTGGLGKLGKVCVADLQAHGYDVFVVDTVAPAQGIPHLIADFANFGQTLDALSSVGMEIYAGVAPQAFDAVVQLGEHEILLSIEKARWVLGYEPDFSWREAKSR